jgi:hypothetical protein
MIQAHLIARRLDVVEHDLVLVFARVICDFWSACLFANHLCVVYAQLEKGVPADDIQIVQPKITYQHIAAQERASFVRNPEIPFRLAHYWEGRSTEEKNGDRDVARIARLPSHPVDAQPSFSFMPLKIIQRIVCQFKDSFVCPEGVAIDVADLGQLLTLAALDVVLFQLLKANDFIFGYNMSIRETYPTSTFGLFGPLNNQAILRVDMSSCSTFTDVIVMLHRELSASRKFAYYPYAKVGTRLGTDRLPIQACS